MYFTSAYRNTYKHTQSQCTITDLKQVFNTSNQSYCLFSPRWVLCTLLHVLQLPTPSPTTLCTVCLHSDFTEKMEVVRRDIFHLLTIKLSSLMQHTLIFYSAISFMEVVCSVSFVYIVSVSSAPRTMEGIP